MAKEADPRRGDPRTAKGARMVARRKQARSEGLMGCHGREEGHSDAPWDGKAGYTTVQDARGAVEGLNGHEGSTCTGGGVEDGQGWHEGGMAKPSAPRGGMGEMGAGWGRHGVGGG